MPRVDHSVGHNAASTQHPCRSSNSPHLASPSLPLPPLLSGRDFASCHARQRRSASPGALSQALRLALHYAKHMQLSARTPMHLRCTIRLLPVWWGPRKPFAGLHHAAAALPSGLPRFSALKQPPGRAWRNAVWQYEGPRFVPQPAGPTYCETHLPYSIFFTIASSY